jgi:hypothetical protein
MNLRFYIGLAVLFGAAPAQSATIGYAYCGSNGAYVMLYQSAEQLEILGHLRCNEKVEVLTRSGDYTQVRTQDGKVGWVHYSEISVPVSSAPATDSGAAQPGVPGNPAVPALTNTNIVKMHAMRLSTDVIIAKIHASPCQFDTSTAALEKLKRAGLPDKVILAMVEAPSASASATAIAKKPDFVAVKIPVGTPIEVELAVNISSDASQDAMIVPMKVTQDVVVNGVTVFQRGAEARAQVTSLKQPGFMNRPPGEIGWTMDYVTAVNGEHVSAAFFSKSDAGNPISSVMGASGPSWEFRKGKPVVVAAGQRFDTVVHVATLVKIPPSVVAAASSTQDAQESAQGRSAIQQPPTKP